MGKMFFWTQGRNYGKSQFFKHMKEEMSMSRNKKIPLAPTEGFEIVEVTTNKYRTLPVVNGIVMMDSDETIRSVKEKRKEDPAIYNPENLAKAFEKGLKLPPMDSIQEAVRNLESKEVKKTAEEQDVHIVDVGESYTSVIEELSETYVKKNADYGNSFEKTLDKRGLIPAIVRMEEKMERMEKLWETEETLVKDEDIIDSAMDLANYAIMTAMWLKKKQIKTNNVEIWADDMRYGGADFDGDTIKISDKEISSFNFPIGQQFNSNDK